VAAFAAFGVARAPSAAGQAALRLTPPSAQLSQEFTRISGVRELPDGRLLISDGGDRSLWVADWRSNRTRRIGREGNGPGEYMSAGALLPGGGDTTLFIDAMGSRYLLIAGDSIVETLAPGSPALRAGARNPLGADRGGRVLFTRGIGMGSGRSTGMPRLDSLQLVRVSRATGAMDTIATMRARPSRIATKGPLDKLTAVEVVTNPLASGDLATSFEDGWIAIARVSPFQVEWIPPSGPRVSGPVLPAPTHAPSDADKRDVLRRLASQSGTEPADPASRDDWPERMPPFLPGALIPAASGDLWIRRTPVAGRAENVFDVVNRRGALTARLTLPESERVVGVSRSAVYVVLTDADGIQLLRRYYLSR
jgi:hypothetical protein